MRKAVFFLVLCVAACGPAYKPLQDYNASRAVYKRCVIDRGVENCRTEKALMDADARAYAATSGQMIRIDDKE